MLIDGQLGASAEASFHTATSRTQSVNMSNGRAIFRIAVWRLLEFRREPTAIFWVFGFPQLILIVLGLTFTDRPPESLRIDFIDQSGSAVAKRLRAELEADSRIIFNAPDKNPVRRLQRVGSSLLVTVERDAGDGDWPEFELQYDPDRPDSVHARAIVEAYIAGLVAGGPRVRVISARSQRGRYVDFLLPGLLAVGAMGASLVWFGYGLVEMRMLRLLRVLLATPLRGSELLVGLLLARWCLLVPEVAFVLLVGRLLFGITVAGNLITLIVILLIGATTFAALGLLIGCRGRKLETVSGWVSVLMLSQWVFCGVFFAREVFPPAWQPWLRWLPLSAFVDATRAVLQDGAELIAVAAPLGIMFLWAVFAAGIGRVGFRVD